MKLYETDARVLKAIDWETGEILDTDLLDIIVDLREEHETAERRKWIEQLCMEVKNLNSNAAELAAEEARLAERRQKIEAKANRLHELVQSALSGEKFSTARVDVTYRRTNKTVVNDNEKAFVEWARENGRDDLLNYPAPRPALTAIKNALEAEGEDSKIPAKVAQNVTMYIK